MTETILEEAQRLTTGDRQADYGHPIDDFSRTAGMVSAMLRHKLKEALTYEDIALIMVQVKISRQINRRKRDNLVDGAGYLNCLDMCYTEDDAREYAQRLIDKSGG